MSGSFFIFTIFENIDEKVQLSYLNNKLNYSYMLILSLSHELFTPINHIVNSSGLLVRKINEALEANSLKAASDNMSKDYQIDVQSN